MSTEMDKFKAARLLLIRTHVFFGSISMMLELKEDPTLPFAAATDGKRLLFNPELSKVFSFGETVAVVAHEVLHVILLHHLRRGQRNHRKWNYACDFAVNLIVEEQGKMFGGGVNVRLPAGCLLDKQFEGMPSEEIYNLIPDPPEQEGGCSCEGEGDGQQGQKPFDEVMDGTKGMSESEVAAEEGRVKAAVQNAAQLARKAGQMNGSLERLVEALCEPKASWRSIIRDYLTEKAETDFNWARPNQRMMSQFGVVYPTLDGEKIGRIVMLIDASGSCYNDQEQFCAEVSDILGAYECSLDVIFHDSQVTGIDHYESDDLPIVMRPVGFGGTDVSEAFETASEFDPDVIIMMSDLEVSFSNVTPPSCDVIVACSHKPAFDNCPSWGRLIDIS